MGKHKAGDVVLLETVVGRIMLGRFVSRDVATTTIRDVCRVYECGVWSQFLAGKLTGTYDSGNEATASIEPEPEEAIEIPTQLCWLRSWPGDLDAIRAGK